MLLNAPSSKSWRIIYQTKISKRVLRTCVACRRNERGLGISEETALLSPWRWKFEVDRMQSRFASNVDMKPCQPAGFWKKRALLPEGCRIDWSAWSRALRHDVRAFIFIARTSQHFLPSSTRVELHLPTSGLDPFFFCFFCILANTPVYNSQISSSWGVSNSRTKNVSSSIYSVYFIILTINVA